MGDAAAVAAWMRRAGVAPLTPDLGVAALAQAIRLGDTTVTIADIDWSRYAPGLASVRPTYLLDTIPAGIPISSGSKRSPKIKPPTVKCIKIPSAKNAPARTAKIAMTSAARSSRISLIFFSTGRLRRGI